MTTWFTGWEVAPKTLPKNPIYDVRIVPAKGVMSDHHNPVDKTINLSPAVYDRYNIAAAVAIDEWVMRSCQPYNWLSFRSQLVPTVGFSAGIELYSPNWRPYPFGLILFAITVQFTLIILPVKFDSTEGGLGLNFDDLCYIEYIYYNLLCINQTQPVY